MWIELLKKDFRKESINIKAWNNFSHLRDFLVNDSAKYIKSKLCSVYGYLDDEKIIWYISLSATNIKLKWPWFGKLDIKDLEDIQIPIPWILIWKLLISEEYRWKSIWKHLLIALINKCYDLSKEMWVRFIIVDSHNDAVLFYKKYWFIEISDSGKTKKMVFDLKIFDKF